MSDFTPIICIDFDGVLHSYTSGWQGADKVIDPPVPGALEWLRSLVDGGKVTPMIYSSRTSQEGGRMAMHLWLAKHAYELWGTEQAQAFMERIEFPEQKPAAFLTIDDRALCFDGSFPDAETMRAFKPWNKREAIGGSALQALTGAYHALRSYQFGNAATELAEGAADKLKEYFPALRSLP